MDQQWKIQEETFIRWINKHLKVQELCVNSIAADFEDGVLLIVLLEVLSHKCLGTYFKKPLVIAQKVDNLEIAFNFIDKEGIRQEDIGKANNYKLWTIIIITSVIVYIGFYLEIVVWGGGGGELILYACARKMFGAHTHVSVNHTHLISAIGIMNVIIGPIVCVYIN